MDREKEMQSWCYLDNAAMTWPKPLRVRQAVADAMVSGGGNPGRGAHKLSMKASVLVYRAREAVAAMFGASPEQVVFLQNTTYALNTAIKGLLHPGDHVLCSDLEHNAVLRPLEKRMREGQGDYTVFPSFACERGQTPEKICAALEARILPQTRMVVCTHASNICSAQMPLAEIGALCKKRGLLFVVDAAQSAGILPIDMKRMQIDALCMPGHKGLYGPAYWSFETDCARGRWWREATGWLPWNRPCRIRCRKPWNPEHCLSAPLRGCARESRACGNSVSRKSDVTNAACRVR